MDQELLNLLPQNTTEFPNTIVRQTGEPLEAFTVFSTMELAEKYITTDLAYPGQQIAIYDTAEEKYKYYIIQEQENTKVLDPIADLSILSKYIKGPESTVTENSVPVFSATDGKSIKGSDVTISDDGQLDVTQGGIKLNAISAPSESGGATYSPGTSGQVLKSNGSTVYWTTDSNTVPSAYCSTADKTAEKVATCTNYALTPNTYIHILLTAANAATKELTLNINEKGAKPIYINGTISSAENCILPAGTYIVYYDGTNYYFRTDGKLPANISGNAVSADKLNTNAGDSNTPVYFKDGAPTALSYKIEASVPSDAKFTDTTYEDATSGKSGLLSGTDKTHLDTMWKVWAADDGSDTLVNKVEEVLKIFEGYTEGDDVATILSGKAPTLHTAADGTYGLATAALYGHAKASSTVPKANGTATAGTEVDTFARGDHIHPLQTDVSGNAGSADKLNSNAGSATQPIYFVDGKPVATTYALNKTVPADAKFTDTDEKVKTTTRGDTDTTNYYLVGAASATTGGLKYDTGIKMGNATGELIMSMCNVKTSAEPAGMTYDSELRALRFVVN